MVGGTDHIEKGFNDLNSLIKLVNEGDLDANDSKIANIIIEDLKDALKGLVSPNPNHPVNKIK